MGPVMVEAHAICQVRWFACYRIKYEVRALTLAVGADAAIRILLRSAIRRRAAHVPHVAVFTVRVATLRREVWEWRAVVKAMKIVTPVYVQVIVLAVATCMRLPAPEPSCRTNAVRDGVTTRALAGVPRQAMRSWGSSVRSACAVGLS